MLKKDKNQKRHADKKDLTGEHKYGDSGQIIFLIIFFTGWILDSFIFHFSTAPFSQISFYVRLVPSIVILCFSGYLINSAHKIIFQEIRKKPEVIKIGVFRIVRHPMYLGSILFYFSMIILFPSLISIIIWIFIVIFYIFISRYEEKLLVNRFDMAYIEYQKNTPMLLPFLSIKVIEREKT